MWKRCARSPSSASRVATAPPSAVVMFFVGKNEKVVRSASEPTGRPAVGRTDRVGGVLDDERADTSVPISRDGVDLDGVTGVVDARDDPGLVGHRRLERGGIDVGRVLLDVDEADLCAERQRARRRRDEGHRGGDHLVTRADAGGGVRDVQGGGAARGTDAPRSRRSARARASSKAVDRRAGRQPVAAQHLRDRLDVVLVDRLATVGDHLRPRSSRILTISSPENHWSLLSEV